MKLRQRIFLALATMALLAPSALAAAQQEAVISSSGKAVFHLYILDSKGEAFSVYDYQYKDPNAFVASRDFQESEIQQVLAGVQYWADIISTKNQEPVSIYLLPITDPNAYAMAYSWYKGQNGSGTILLQDVLQQGLTIINPDFDGWNENIAGYSTSTAGLMLISIGQGLGMATADSPNGWSSDTETIIPTNEAQVDLTATMRHEMAHALGFMAAIQTVTDAAGVQHQVFSTDVTSANSWNLHMMDQNGNMAKPGMEIITTAEFNARQAADPSIQKSDYFIVDTAAGKFYFAGTNVTEALNGATFDGYSAIPLRGSEATEYNHVEMKNGLMSHQYYRNYTTLMEVELAVLQDLGYDLDRRNYFGSSIYASDLKDYVNTAVYYARNAEGTAYLTGEYNTTPLGMGLHIYGSNNNITQVGEILTAGTGSVGIRMDGSNNKLTIEAATQIRADGKRGIGILVAYGREHNITQLGTVTALGEGGNAVQFDFGSNVLGSLGDYRGSYIRYYREAATDSSGTKVYTGTNMSFADNGDDYPATPELEGALVDTYTVKGTLAGSKNAIYISKNALVRNINIEEGANIFGNITSAWKHFDTEDSIYAGLKLQYNGNQYAYDCYIPDLVTNLNINTDFTYAAAISGADNIKLKVNEGSFIYNGTADVINVEVAEGAQLLGGSYVVNDLSSKLADGFTDTSTGQLINNGLIGASGDYNTSSVLSITGTLTNNGTIGVWSDGDTTSQIAVNGTAVLSAATNFASLSGSSFLPGQTLADVVTATSIVAENELSVSSFSGLLNAMPVVNDGVDLVLTAANNTGVHDATFAAVNSLYASTEDEELGTLYALDKAEAATALTQLTGGLAEDMAHDAIQNRDVRTALREQEHLQRTDGLWMLLDKHWSRYDNTDGHGFTTTIGKDFFNNEKAYAGALFAYSTNTLSDKYDSGDYDNYTLGLYGGTKNAAGTWRGYISYGLQDNSVNRNFTALGRNARADYDSSTLGVGVRYAYDLQYGNETKAEHWHTLPYAQLNYTHYKQDGYTEKGAGIYERQVAGYSDNYADGELGLEIKRTDAYGSYGFSLGYRRILTGEQQESTAFFTGDGSRTAFTSAGTAEEKDHVVVGAFIGTKFSDKWSAAGQLQQDWSKSSNELHVNLVFNYSF